MNINNNKHLKPYNINVLQIKNITSSQIFQDDNFLNKIYEYFPITKPDFFKTEVYKNEIQDFKKNNNLLSLINNYETTS